MLKNILFFGLLIAVLCGVYLSLSRQPEQPLPPELARQATPPIISGPPAMDVANAPAGSGTASVAPPQPSMNEWPAAHSDGAPVPRAAVAERGTALSAKGRANRYSLPAAAAWRHAAARPGPVSQSQVPSRRDQSNAIGKHGGGRQFVGHSALGGTANATGRNDRQQSRSAVRGTRPHNEHRHDIAASRSEGQRRKTRRRLVDPQPALRQSRRTRRQGQENHRSFGLHGGQGYLLARGLAGAAYGVRPGDTLDSIADRYKVPSLLLARINGISDPQNLSPGKELKVLKGPFIAKVSTAPGR